MRAKGADDLDYQLIRVFLSAYDDFSWRVPPRSAPTELPNCAGHDAITLAPATALLPNP
jgi:hypothetical protein